MKKEWYVVNTVSGYEYKVKEKLEMMIVNSPEIQESIFRVIVPEQTIVEYKDGVKKENVFKIIGKYFKGVFKEIKRIRWTDKKDLLKYSICTLVFVLFFGLYFYAIDWIVLLVRSLAN